MRHYELPRCARAIFTIAFLALCLCFSGPVVAQESKCIPIVEHVEQAKAHPNFLAHKLLTAAEFKVAIAHVQAQSGDSDKFDTWYLALRADGVMVFFVGRDGAICAHYKAGPEAAERLLQAIAGQGA